MGEVRDARTSAPAGWRWVLAGAVLGVIGAVVAVQLWAHGGWVGQPWAAVGLSPSDTNASTLQQLEKVLAAEVEARRQLSDRVSELDAELSLLRFMADERAGSALARAEPLPADPTPEQAESEEAKRDLAAGAQTSRFDDEALLTQGIHPREVARLHDLWVGHELERASLANRSLREGWFYKGRHRQALKRLEQELREELQEEGYDRYLYALGHANRLRAGEVLDGSAASEAGLLRGDVILRYGDTRVFKPGELLMAASRGEPGESVAVEILRNGRRQTVYMRRGPLGVVMERSRGAPLRE